MFAQSELIFQAGLYANRSPVASKNRWVDGNLVRFKDGVPAQIGGWTKINHVGVAVSGKAREMIAWRPNNQAGRLSAIGTHTNVYQFDGGSVVDITPVGLSGGRADSILGVGFGAGLFGIGLYGTPRVSSDNTLQCSNWSFDMFGEQLVACFNTSGQIYDYLAGTDATLQTVAVAPTANAICISDERHVFAFGCDGFPGLVRWSDREDYTSANSWTPLATNRAGAYDMQVSSPFQCGMRCRGQVVAWTFTDMVTFFPLGNSLVYGRETLSTHAGVMGPHAACVINDGGGELAIWMGADSFYQYDGLVRKLDCELWDFVFKDLNITQRSKFQARSNLIFDEVWFFYVSAASTEIDRAVIYNFANRSWSKAEICRLCWLDQRIFPLPIAIDDSGNIFQHEDGETDDGNPIDSFALSFPVMQGVGQRRIEIDAFWPDMQADSGGAQLTVIGRGFSGDADEVFGPYAFTAADDKLDLTIDTRLAQIKIEGIGHYWELGIPKISSQPGSER